MPDLYFTFFFLTFSHFCDVQKRRKIWQKSVMVTQIF